MNEDRISVNGCWNKGLRGQMRENRGEGECVWCMGLGARPERIPKASRRNGGRGNEKMARNIYVAPIMWHKEIESFNQLKTHVFLNTKA
mgnify:CR=1 FL=1